MLEGLGLTFRYNNKQNWLLQDKNICIAPGERVALPGASGQGKSTLAKILASYLPATRGVVLVDGKKHTPGAFNPVQLLFQHPELAVNPRWKIKDVLQEADKPQTELLELLGVDLSWMERYPHELSGGELQRICLVRALGPKTRYLLCDEMSSMLDPYTQAMIWKAVLSIAESRQLGLLVISHDKRLLKRICQRSVDFFSCCEN